MSEYLDLISIDPFSIIVTICNLLILFLIIKRVIGIDGIVVNQCIKEKFAKLFFYGLIIPFSILPF